jgi:EAL domain-containing protein (putative c-di-GMP-specific phosphodiesterase class I)
MQVTAEGIEDPRVAEDLRRLGCDSGQGFHFGVPAEGAADVVEVVRKRGRG